MSIMIIFEDSDTYAAVRLTSRPLILGRSSKAGVQLADGMCSGQHASLHLAQDGNVILTDLDSTNGTYINETLISTASRLFVEDEVRIGDTRLTIDKSSLTPRERQVLTSNSNKTSFTKIELPGLDQDKLSIAKQARQKAMGVKEEVPVETPKPETEEEAPEISVIFDKDELQQKVEKEPESEPKQEEKKSSATPPPEPKPGEEVEFEMEASSGKTKMIKLDRNSLTSTKKSSRPVHTKRNTKKEQSGGLFSKVKNIFGKND